LKPERWGSPLVQEKYQEEMPVTGDIHNNNNNIDWRMTFDRANWTKLMQILKEAGTA